MPEERNPEPEPPNENVVDSAATEKKIAELEDSWRRAAADLENLRKRCAKDVVRAREQERASVAALWLPVLDNLERALEHASSSPDQIVEGVRAVHQQALAVLAGLGYPRREDETGKAFDPAHHEAVSTITAEDLVPGTVAGVVLPGYGPDGAVLRPASVVVVTRGE